MTDPVIMICERTEDYLEACGAGGNLVPVLSTFDWSRSMVERWADRLSLSITAPIEGAPAAGKSSSARMSSSELHVLSLRGDSSADTVVQAFTLMRSAAPFSFVDWRSAAAHQRVQAPTVHTVVIGIDRRPSMRDIAMFGEQTGFIAVDSADLATFMLAKTVAYSMRPEGRDICFAPVHKGKDMADAGGLVMLPADSPQLRDWRVAIDGNESVVSIVGHASEDYLRLSSEELVCGRRSVRRPDRSGNRLPTCMIDGGCVLPGLRRTGPEDLPGAVFFSNACLSLKVDGGIFDGGDSYTVSQRFLEANAAAFVASPLLKDGRVEENLVFHGLMGAGLTLGQTVRELNRFLREWHFEAGKVLILGDPSIRTSTHLASGMSAQFKKGLLFGAKDEAPHLPDEDCCVADAPPRAVSGFVRGDAVPGSRAILLDRPPKTDSEPRIVPRPVTPEDALRRIRQILDQYDRCLLYTSPSPRD